MKKKIALIGCGTWGQNILRELSNLGVEVHVYEKEPGLEERVLELGAQHLKTGLPSSKEQFDGLIIATPSTTHRQVLEKVMELNLPIFLEKPLTTNLDDALALEKIRHKEIYMMHIWLYHPGILMLKEIAESREIGKVLGVKSTRANWTSPRKDADSAWNLSPHDVSIAKAIFGFIPEPKSAIAEWHDGVIRGLTALLGDEPYCVFEVSNRYEHKIREVRLHCENGVAILENEKVDFIKVVWGNSTSDPENMRTEYRTFDNTPPLQIEIKEFLDYLNGGKKPKSSFEDGVEIIKTIHKLIGFTQ